MTAKLKSKLEEAREALAKALTASHAGGKQLAKLERDRASISSQVEQLEAASERDLGDSDAVARLSTLREQQRLFDKKIAKIASEQERDLGKCERDLGETEHAATELLIECGRPILDAISKEARLAFGPFYRDPARLSVAVERNDRIMSLKAYLVNAGTGLVPVNEKGQRLLGILDRLIAGGDIGWTWQTAPAPAAPTPTAPEATPAPKRTAARRAASVLA